MFGAGLELPGLAIRPADTTATLSLFEQLLADTSRERIFLIEAAPIVPLGPLLLEDATPFLLEDSSPLLLEGGDFANLRWSTHGFNSEPTDDPANAHWAPRIRQALAFDRAVVRGGALQPRAIPTVSQIELANGDGGLDELLGHSWSGTEIAIKMGAGDLRYDQFGVVARLRARAVVSDEDIFSIRLRDLAAAIDVPIQTSVYTGGGGPDGTPDLAGRPRPRCLGICREIPCVPVEPGLLLYQYNDGPVDAVLAVYDAAVALQFSADYQTVAALRSASIPQGHYATCTPEGYLRIAGVGGISVGQVTADVRGHRFAGLYVDDAPSLMRRAVEAWTNVPAGQIDLAAFAAAALEEPGPVGLWIGTEQRTVADVLDEFAVHMGASWHIAREPLLTLTIWGPPSGVPAASYDATQIKRLTPLLHEPPFDVPIARVGVNWGRIYHVPPQDSIPESVAQARRAYLAQERRLAVAENPAIYAEYPEAGTPAPVPSLYDQEQDAQAKADKLLAVYGVPRRSFAAELDVQPFTRRIGEVVRMAFPRFGLVNGRTFRIAALNEDAAASSISVELWG